MMRTPYGHGRLELSASSRRLRFDAASVTAEGIPVVKVVAARSSKSLFPESSFSRSPRPSLLARCSLEPFIPAIPKTG
jgi:hypothetical protein